MTAALRALPVRLRGSHGLDWLEEDVEALQDMYYLHYDTLWYFGLFGGWLIMFVVLQTFSLLLDCQ